MADLWRPKPGKGSELSEDERLLASLAASYDTPQMPTDRAVVLARTLVGIVLAIREEK